MNRSKILLFVLVLLLLQVFAAPLINSAKAQSHEYFYSVVYTPYDTNSDGYNDAVDVRMDVDTNGGGTIGVSVVANLYDPYGAFADSDNPSWTITGTGVEYGYAHMHTLPNVQAGYYDVEIFLYDEFGTYEDLWYTTDAVWLYAPNYTSDEFFYSAIPTSFDESGDGYNDAVQVAMDVDTTDGTMQIWVQSYLIDPNGENVDNGLTSWTITGGAAEYGYLTLHVYNGGLQGNYDVQLFLYDPFGFTEDTMTIHDIYLYAPNFASDEWFWTVTPNPFDNSGDGYNDVVAIKMDVDTSDYEIGVTVSAILFDPNGIVADNNSVTWTITGTQIEYGSVALYARPGGPVGYYDVELYLYDEYGNYEGSDWVYDVYLYPPDYASAANEWFYSAYYTAFDSSGDGYNDSVTITMDVDTTDGTLGVYVQAYYYGPDNSFVNSYYSEWTITGMTTEYGYSYLYLPNGALVGNYRVELYLYDEWDNYEDHVTITGMYLYPPDYASAADEYFYRVDYAAYDSNGDGYNDAVMVTMDVDTTDGTIDVEVVANLFNTTGDVCEVDVALWTITGATVEYGYAYLHVPNGSAAGNYAFELMLYDEFGNYEDYELFYDIYLYPPDYVSAADEYFSSITYQAYDSNGDGWNDAVEVEMDVSTTDGTLDVFVYAYLIDSNGVYVDSDFPTWTITGVMPEYGYAYLYVPSSGHEGDYHVELFLYDEFANYEDYRYQLISGLYPPNYASDEYFYSVTYTPYDSNSDGWNDTVVVAMDVDTTDGTLGVNVAALLIDYYGVWVDSEYVSWTITGTVSDTFYVYLHVPDNATVYYYSVELFLYDQWDHDEDYRYGSNVVWLWPANYGSHEYFVTVNPTAVDSNGDGYNDSVTVWMNADTDDHSLGVYVEAYLRDPNGAVVSFDNPDWGITGSNVENNYASLYLPNGSPVGYCDVELYLYDQWGHLEDYRYFSDAVFLYPKNYPDFNGDGVIDVLDAAAISAHWFPGPPVGPMGYDAKYDLNNDGAVDVLDAAVVSAYWTGPPKGPLAP